jgi:hypothetical protein
MPTLDTEPTNVMSSAAGFHGDNTGWQRSEEIQKSKASDALAKHNRANPVLACDAANRLAQINPKNRDIHKNDPFLFHIHCNRSCIGAERQFIPLGQL